MGIFNEKYLREIEKEICMFKEQPVLLLPHTNDYTTSRIYMACLECGGRFKLDVNTGPYVHPEIVKCPYCDCKRAMAHVNFNSN
jgi:DNA-directed RNA polymerase subunit RPC12/RpoP